MLGTGIFVLLVLRSDIVCVRLRGPSGREVDGDGVCGGTACHFRLNGQVSGYADPPSETPNQCSSLNGEGRPDADEGSALVGGHAE